MDALPERDDNGLREKIAVAGLIAANLLLIGFLYYCFHCAIRTGITVF